MKNHYDFFENIFNVWYNRRQPDFHICFYSQFVATLCFWKKQEVIGRYSSLILYQNSISGNFLKVICNVKSETTSINFLYPVTLKSIDLYFMLNGFFMHACFCYILHWLIEKYWFTELYRSSKCYDIWFYSIKRPPSLKLLPISPEKCFSFHMILIVDIGFPEL